MGLSFSVQSLRNGLRVVFVNDPQAREVQVTTRYAVGAVDDPADQPGMAHLVEHLMFQQTLGEQSIFAQLESFATSWNAATSLDATTYYARAQPQHLDRLLSIEAVRMGLGCTSISDTAFAREREVVVQESKLYAPLNQLIGAVKGALYPAQHPYRRDVGGTVESIRSITKEQACAFVDAHYGPGNAVIVIAGATAERLEVALGKFIAKVPARTVTQQAALPAPPLPGAVAAPGPLERDVVLVSWPIPDDPLVRAQLIALTPSLVSLIDAHVEGPVIPFPLGDARAPRLSLFVLPVPGETPEHAIEGIRAAIAELPSALASTSMPLLDAFQFDTIRQSAIYAMLSSLDDGSDRDSMLAAEVLAGRDPDAALAAEATGLQALHPASAVELVTARLGLKEATIVTLKARIGDAPAQKFPASAPAHDIGLRRTIVDPSSAHRFSGDARPATLTGIRTRVLANGLRVVLMPITSIPTVDMRLIFAAGTGDDGTRRGVALAAAKALTWHPRYVNDALRFIAAGGADRVNVGLDHTSFIARGADMHIDVLLAGLRRWVRDGVYDFNNKSLAIAIRKQRKDTSEDDALDDAMRAALYGPDHPYTRAGLLRHASEELTPEIAERFRAAYYTPDNATLVIAGRFAPDVADSWIDFLFGDWAGHARQRIDIPRTSASATFVKGDELAQVRVDIQMPATAGSRAHRLIAAAMLDEIASDVRHQLAASYTLNAGLVETRLATDYRIAGWIDATRTTEAVQLLADRIRQLQTDPAAAEGAFVHARQRVFNRLASVTRSSTSLADRAELDIALLRAPMSNLSDAARVARLTVDDMAPTLAELDLATAVIAMHGPTAETERALAVLGRAPTHVALDTSALAAMDARPLPQAVERESTDFEYAPPITLQPPPPDVSFAVMPGFTSASVGTDYDSVSNQQGTSGFSIAGELGHRVTQRATVGVHAGIGALSGNYRIGDNPVKPGAGHTVVDVLGYFQLLAFDRVWGAVLLGLHGDRTNERVAPFWYMGIATGIEAGVDVLVRGPNRVGAVIGLTKTLISDVDYSAVTLGVTYRYR